MDLDAIQRALREHDFDGWLFYDHHYRDPLSYRILGLGEGLHVTRRWFYYIPAEGEPKKLVHRIEAGRLDALPGAKAVYSSWQELELQVGVLTAGATTIAMQYSPKNAIMYISMVDAGTVEMVRGLGKEIVSSADLVSQFEAVLNDDQIATHYVAQQKIDAVLDAAWKELGRRTRAGGTHEFAMVEFLSEGMSREGLVWEHGPNVSAGANSADSHYEPTAGSSKRIGRGDFVLIDIWGKLDRPDACYYDITWTGMVDREPTQREQMVFETVRDARDAAVKVVQDAFAAGRQIAGWQADDAARNVIAQAGLGEWFTHRTGHNIGPILHG
ncbi:MAG TPA: M24 family metallopeptidase, partial [Edaphobacter sp.]|nr:M24 family metallopeptidase [Edaphobacter sp.]